VRQVMAHSVPLLPEKFDGSQNYNDWVSHFECVSKINDWSDREKALWLWARVSGRAHVAYNLLSHEIQESFDLCTDDCAIFATAHKALGVSRDSVT